jgi:protein-tyrosine phosphatase
VIDLHAHVLPGIDDGPADVEASREMLAVAAADGTRVIAATPHLREDHPLVRPERIAPGCSELAGSHDGIELVPGGEVDLAWALSAEPEELELVTYGGRGTDLLLETPYGELTETFEELVFGLRARGLRVMLAHPELNPTFQRTPGRLAELVQTGVLLQLTARSLVAGRRSATRRLAESLVREGLAHVLASDAHSPGPWRPPGLSEGVAAVEAIAPGRGEWMVTAAPAAILAGEPLPAAPALPRAGGGRLGRLLRRGGPLT